MYANTLTPSAPPAPSAPPPTYEEAKVHHLVPYDKESALTEPPPVYDGQRTLPAELDFLPAVEVIPSSSCQHW
ncbi:hypothetical protein Q1695_007565 [Nippostrongylus brasiliensis]|nr:hypothetical protein Q1695_007565 [Nippostrongylus brasiliensis]